MNWFKSVTFYAVVGFFILAVMVYIETKDIEQASAMLFLGLGFFGVRKAINKVASSKETPKA